MAITNFIPELWSANILLELQKNLVYGSAVNRDYEGDIANYGDTVHITGIAHISIGDYTAHTDITIEPATDKDAGELVIDQSKYFAFEIDDAGRWVIVNPDFYGLLRKDTRFVAGAESAHSTLLNGVVGEAAGMTILKSNNAPAAKGGSASAQTDEGNVIIAGTNAATTFAEQIAKVEATRKEKGFDDIVKGLHLYGAKVVRPEALATVHFKVGK